MSRILGISLCALLLLGGCDDDSEPLSEEDFVTQANEICKQGTDELKALGPTPAPSRKVGPWEAISLALEGVASIDFEEAIVAGAAEFEEVRDRLEEIEPPEADADDMDFVMSTLDVLVGYFQDFAEAIEDEDEDRIVELEEREEELSDSGVGQELEATLTRLGLDDCADFFGVD